MKKILFIFVLLSGGLSAQTSVPGGNVSGTWTPGGSPYTVSGGIMVASGTTLVIQPGVTVNFQGHYKFLIKGTLVAVGTAASIIKFTAASAVTGWYGLRIDSPALTQDSTLLKYCWIERGIANGSGDDASGGGIFLKNFSKVAVNSCTITNNTQGGGMICTGSDITILNNTFSYNTGAGLGVSNSNAIIKGNIMQDNKGNGLWTGPYGYSVTVTSNTMIGNICLGSGYAAGGGIYIGGTALVSNNVIVNNETDWDAGGIYCYQGSSATLLNNQIVGNHAANGGGIFCLECTPVIIGNIFSNNFADFTGGAILDGLPAGTATITNNLFVNNSAGTDGAALWLGAGADHLLTNNTIANNSAGGDGGGLYCSGAFNPILKNCIFYGNRAGGTGPQVYIDVEPCDPNFYYCDIQGGSNAFGMNGNFYTGTYNNNIDMLPIFVSPSAGSGTLVGSISADWRLDTLSPCINTGALPGPYPTTDIAGNARITGSAIDMGAYEYNGDGPITNTLTSPTNTTVVTGIKNQLADEKAPVVSPNPFSTATTFQLKNVRSGTLQVYNQEGQEVKKVVVTNADQVLVDRGDLPAALYFFTWNEKDGGSYSGKLIVVSQ